MAEEETSWTLKIIIKLCNNGDNILTADLLLKLYKYQIEDQENWRQEACECFFFLPFCTTEIITYCFAGNKNDNNILSPRCAVIEHFSGK